MKEAIRFGKYLFLQRINVGGMAEVFKAKTFGVEGFEKLVAIKRILPSIAEDDEFIKMFIDEAKITVRLQHANIAQVYELGKIDDSYFIAMEFINGKDLKQLFERAKKISKPMDIAQACYIVSQLCSGLDYAHRKKDDRGVDLNIVHRDVSPQNVRISYDGEVKVIDFGIAKAKNKSSKTEAGILKGKFGYMSPEQVRGKVIDKRSDIFAIGIIFYELLTATRLFQGETDFSTLEKIRNVDIDPITNRNSDIPKELEEIVMKSLTSKRENRYKFASDMHDDLQKFMILNNFMYSRTDLSSWMKKTYFKDIEKDLKKLKEFDNYDSSAFNQAEDSSPGYNTNSNNSNSAASNNNENYNNNTEPMEWDDDELETQIFDKAPSFVGETPEEIDENNKNSKYDNLPKKDLVKDLKDRKRKQKQNKMMMMIVFAIAAVLLVGFAYFQFMNSNDEAEANKFIDYKMNIDLQVIPNNNLSIYMNNKLIVANESTPYLIQNLTPGVHKLKIEKPGFLAFTKDINIPKITKKIEGDLKVIGNSRAIKEIGLTYNQYVDGVIDLVANLKEKNLETLTINIEPSDGVKLYFNNKLVSESSPYSIKNLKRGKYKLKVTKEGFSTQLKEVELTEEDISKSVKNVSVKLVAEKGVAIQVETIANTKLFIDDKEIEGSTPYKISVSEGKHTFKVKGALYGSLIKEFDCKENTIVKMKPKQKYVNLTIKSKPAGATVYLYDKNKLKSKISEGVTPVTKKVEISNLTAIRLEKDKYQSSSLKYKWNKRKKQSLSIKLQKEGSTPVKIVRKAKTKTSKQEVKVAKSTKYGYISIISRPATSIKVDGRNLGRKTPLIKFKISAGKHRITLYNKAKGINDTFTVKVSPKKVSPIIKKY